MTKRCPWCGEIINRKKSYFNTNRCDNCGNNYKAYRKSIRYLVLFSISVILLIATFIMELPICSFAFLAVMGINELIISLCPYVKDSEHYIVQKRQYATISIYDKVISKIRFSRLLIVENQILTICFVSENNTPLSNMICVSLENIKWKQKSRNLTCVFAYLPLGKLDRVYSELTKFYIFFNNEKIGEGNLGKILSGFNSHI